jgi:hypothetical protein
LSQLDINSLYPKRVDFTEVSMNSGLSFATLILAGLSQVPMDQPKAPPSPAAVAQAPEFWFGIIEIRPTVPGRPILYGTIIVPVRPGIGSPDHSIGNTPDCDLDRWDFDDSPSHYGVVGPGLGDAWADTGWQGWDPVYFWWMFPEPPPPPLFYSPTPPIGDPYAVYQRPPADFPTIVYGRPWLYKVTLWHRVSEPTFSDEVMGPDNGNSLLP